MQIICMHNTCFEKKYGQVRYQHIAILWYKKMIAPVAKENLGVSFR